MPSSDSSVQAAIQTLQLFNQKAERLNGLRFTASVRANKVNCRYTFGPAGVAVERDLPDPEEIEAFVLTFRMFVQDRDGISFKALDTLYETLPVAPELHAEVRTIRAQVNSYLDGNSPVVLRTHRVSRREVMDVFLYGGLAHADRQKATTFEAWRANPVMFGFLESEFVLLLGIVLQAIFWLRHCNLSALAELQTVATKHEAGAV